MEHKISIIVPVYNGENFIEHCINSVFDLEYSNWELIIVNDGSIDSTEKLCKQYLIDSRVKYICQNNSGVSSSRNRGIRESTGKYIIFLDADDYLDSRICSFFNYEMSNADFCIAGFSRCFNDNHIKEAFPSVNFASGIYSFSEFSNIFGELYKAGFINSPWAKCYKKQLISAEFNESLNLGEDLIFNLQYMLNCNNVKINFESVYNYKVQTIGTLSSNIADDKFQTLSVVYNETLFLLNKLFTDHRKWESYINEKYILDFMVLLERNIRYNSGFKIINLIRYTTNAYQMNNICRQVSLKQYSCKWEIARKLLAINAWYVFYLYIKLNYLIKKVLNIFKKGKGYV